MKRRTVIVTGGTRGIGRASCVQLAKKGYDIFFTWQKSETASYELVQELQSLGVNAYSFRVDLSMPDTINAFFEFFKNQETADLAGLVNNAAISGERRKVDEYSTEEIKELFAVNFFSTVEFIKQSMPFMSSGQQASIVNVSSQAAIFGGNNLSIYAATKGALNSLTIALSKELGNNNIRVNAVTPGIIQTDQNKSLNEIRKLELSKQIPLGRLGEAQDVANLIAWLISDESSYISGSIIPVHGAR